MKLSCIEKLPLRQLTMHLEPNFCLSVSKAGQYQTLCSIDPTGMSHWPGASDSSHSESCSSVLSLLPSQFLKKLAAQLRHLLCLVKPALKHLSWDHCLLASADLRPLWTCRVVSTDWSFSSLDVRILYTGSNCTFWTPLLRWPCFSLTLRHLHLLTDSITFVSMTVGGSLTKCKLSPSSVTT